MWTNKYCILLILGIVLPVLSFSQHRKKQGYTFLSIPDVELDGNLQEWEGQFYNADNELWNCALALKGNAIYAAVRVKDPMLQREALTNGIVLNLSYNNKKKDGARLLFPVADAEGMRALRQEDEQSADGYREKVLNTARGYYVAGFDKIVDGLLSFQNNYGIQAIVKIDSSSLYYEAVVPLDLIAFKSDDIAVKLAVNTQFSRMQKAVRNQGGRPVGPYGMYGGRSMAIKNPYSGDTEIWISGTIK
jgi:hypothetical protein